MSYYDVVYHDLVLKIVNTGYSDKGQDIRPRYADGSPAYSLSLISEKMIFDGSEVPILTTKKVAWKTAIHELIWFYIKRTSDVSYLRENNVKIWEEWTREDGTIGKAYGFQLGKPIVELFKLITHTPDGQWEYYPPKKQPVFTNQVDRLINGLKNNSSSRRHLVSLWNIDDLHEMSLPPCVWQNQWLVFEGKLHLIVGVRSNDLALGNPFNVFQYYVLQRMVAQVTGYEIGTLTFNINCPHVYIRHIDGLLEQIGRKPYPAPKLLINPDVKNFDDFTINDFELVDYQHHPVINFEVAI